MTENGTMDHSKAKKLHPKLKVRNVKKLIGAIREADSLELARARAAREPLKVGRRNAVCRDAVVRSVEDIGKSKVPLVFFMATWINPAPVDPVMGIVDPESSRWAKARKEPTCGTAACIAGFAAALMPDSAVPRVNWAIRRGEGWDRLLAEFLGVDDWTAATMTNLGLSDRGCGAVNREVQPRHAVRLLEIFLETGKVDWLRAMGRKRVPRGAKITSAELRALRMDEMALAEAA